MNSMKFRQLAKVAIDNWSKEDCFNILKDVRLINRKVAAWVLKKKYNEQLQQNTQ